MHIFRVEELEKVDYSCVSPITTELVSYHWGEGPYECMSLIERTWFGGCKSDGLYMVANGAVHRLFSVLCDGDI